MSAVLASYSRRRVCSLLVLASIVGLAENRCRGQETAAQVVLPPPIVGEPLPETMAGAEESQEPAKSRDVPVQESPSDGPAAPSLVPGATPPATGDAVSKVDEPAASEPQAAKDEAAKNKEHCEKLQKAYAGAYKPVFYDNDFSYLNDPAWGGYWVGDRWKQRCIAERVMVDVGGEYRIRLQNERNMRGLGLTGDDDDFVLQRLRLFGNARFSQDLRVYFELLEAESSFENFPTRVIDVNHNEILNLFVDGVLLRDGASTLTARVGRQELLYGDQRLISPLDWANTRRTFQGVKLMWQANDWKVDGFFTNPVRFLGQDEDQVATNQEFMGIYATHQAKDQSPSDYYVLRQTLADRGRGFEFNTVGTRQTGEFRGWQTLGEFAYQFGENLDGSDHAAGMATVGTGRKLSESSAQPTLWFYYDFASGGDQLGAVQGFYQHFPLAHRYLGFMDFYGRSNIEDVNIQYTWKPADKLLLLLWYHYFTLATPSDTPYTVLDTPFNPTNAPASVKLGQEIDFLATWNFHPRQEMQFGYSHFFRGAYYERTPGVPFRGDADFFYTQYLIRF